MKKVYYWTASSDDTAFEDKSRRTFDSEKECYDDMRNAVLEKMKWNTEHDEDFDDIPKGAYIGYDVKFYKTQIVHSSYSGTYTYLIHEKVVKETNTPKNGKDFACFKVDVIDTYDESNGWSFVLKMPYIASEDEIIELSIKYGYITRYDYKEYDIVVTDITDDEDEMNFWKDSIEEIND